jgi:CHAT domain-containing protein
VVLRKSLLDEEFTLQNFRNNLGRYPIVHIASHFSLNAGNENDSYLLLGGGDERKLTLASVRQGGAKFIGVELLTLSACNTVMSSGSKSNGVEIEGFGMLAQNKGAKSVVASLWAVADSSTRDLMIGFYQQLETNEKIGKADALRNAQLSLLTGKNKAGDNPLWRDRIDVLGSGEGTTRKPFKTDPNAPFAHPYYWSPFILIGNWR